MIQHHPNRVTWQGDICPGQTGRLLRFIRQARDLGLSLAEIRTIIGLRRGETPPGREVITLLQSHLDAIDQKISNLQNLRQAMTGVLHAAATRADQTDLVPLCQVIGPGASARG